MTLLEDLLSKRELAVFLGVENHSTPYNPFLFNKIWFIPDSLPTKNLLIIPINGLGESYKLSKEMVMCHGIAFRVLFVDSPYFTHYAFLFDSFPQTDENNYFTSNCIQFLQKLKCSTIVVCDMGVYKSRSLVNLLNNAITSLGKYNITVCLATILGYNSRGFTDIEIGDESAIYQKDYYLQSDIEVAVTNDHFNFFQIDRKFNLSSLFTICCQSKSPAESKLQEIKEQAQGYIHTLKPLLDANFFRTYIKTLYKGGSFDFISLETNLKKWGFKGNLLDSHWDAIYEKLCRNIRMSNPNNRESHVYELISAIGSNINNTIKFIQSI